MATITRLLERIGIGSFAKQLQLLKLIDDYAWQFDVSAGILSFGNGLRWHAQILGTESHQTTTWLWAWANTGSTFAPALIQASLQMQLLGEQQAITELIEPQIPITDEMNGHVLSMIATGVCDADAYYRGPYDGGAAFLLIKDPGFPRSREFPLSQIATAFPQLIVTFSIADHKASLTSHLDSCGIAYEMEDRKVRVNQDGKRVLSALFDEHNRLVDLKVSLPDN